jgi:hypothetical protein
MSRLEVCAHRHVYTTRFCSALSPRHERGGGSDGDRLREIDVVELPLVPFLYPDRLLRSRRRSDIGRYASATKGPRIPRDQWPYIAARAKREGLRAVARTLGVSHETVRSIANRVESQALTAQLTASAD